MTRLSDSWRSAINHSTTATLRKLSEKLREPITPNRRQIFKAFELCPFEDVKVVIVGHSPYHKEGYANGLAFGVNKGCKLPFELKCIYKEVEDDIGRKPKSRTLKQWARQGVLLLNCHLTTRVGAPNAHSNIGWTRFTDSVVGKLSQEHDGLVFLLWGPEARLKVPFIDKHKHHILCANYPGPKSASLGFLGCRHFSRTNFYLKRRKIQQIEWC